MAAGAERKSVTAAVEHYIQTKITIGRSYKHVSDLKDRLHTFAASFPDRGLESITRNELLDWLLGLQPAQSSRSVWNYFGALAALFRYAEKRDWLVVNPITRIDPKSDLPKETKGAEEILSVEQGKAVMRKIEEREPRFIAWACIQYFRGIRASESGSFREEWIRPAEKKIVVPGWHLEGKTKEPVSITRDDWVIHDAPDMPWDFYFDLSRHMWDESRHSMFGEKKLLDLGSTASEAGLSSKAYAMRRTLTPHDRYAALTTQEADAFPGKHAGLKYAVAHRDTVSAMAWSYDIADEMQHVRFGTKWLPVLIE